MYKLIVNDHGKKETVIKGSLKEIVQYLKNNEEIYNWVLDKDPDMKIPDLSEVETLRDIEYELSKVGLGWWSLEIEKIADNIQMEIVSNIKYIVPALMQGNDVILKTSRQGIKILSSKPKKINK